MTESQPDPRVAADIAMRGLAYEIIRFGRVSSLVEAAIACGVEVPDVVKSIVVRRAAGDYVIVLVPGDRSISWPKLRALLGVSRLSLPDPQSAREVTGYERGTITPFGTGFSVIADERVRGRRITLGSGRHGITLVVDADAAVAALDATIADVTD